MIFQLKNSQAGSSAASGSHLKASTIVEKAKLAFNVYDQNRDGYVTKSELRKASKKMTDAQIDAVFEKYDKNKDGRLDFKEFKDLMEARSKSQEEEERTLQHQKLDRRQKQRSGEKLSSQPSLPRKRSDKNKLLSQVSIDREPSPRRKPTQIVSHLPPKITE